VSLWPEQGGSLRARGKEFNAECVYAARDAKPSRRVFYTPLCTNGFINIFSKVRSAQSRERESFAPFAALLLL